MKHPKLEAEYENLLLRQPSYLRVGAFSWIVRVLASLVGYLFLYLAIANLVTGSITLELLKYISDTGQTTNAVDSETPQMFIFSVSAICLFIAVLGLFVAWLTKAIIHRNRHINQLNDFIEKTLESHKITEHSVKIIQGKMK